MNPAFYADRCWMNPGLHLDEDTMRDCYMLDSQRKAYERILSEAKQAAVLKDQLNQANEHLSYLQRAIARDSDQITQILGSALGYPRYCDRPDLFPDATEEDGVCIGEATDLSLVKEAARKIGELKAGFFGPDPCRTQPTTKDNHEQRQFWPQLWPLDTQGSPHD